MHSATVKTLIPTRLERLFVAPCLNSFGLHKILPDGLNNFFKGSHRMTAEFAIISHRSLNLKDIIMIIYNLQDIIRQMNKTMCSGVSDSFISFQPIHD